MDFYHVLNRGVDKRNIVADVHDRLRFIHDLYVFNDSNHALHPKQFNRMNARGTRDLLVHIHAFCLMKNHYHLLLSEVVEGGISKFIQKLNMGYTKYFNEKYDRSGTLWQGKTKKILIERDAHFNYIPFYIHLNPLDYSFPEWREGKVRNPHKALEVLRQYRWSSHLDYINEKNFPSVLYQKEILNMSSNQYKKEIISIIGSAEKALLSNTIE